MKIPFQDSRLEMNRRWTDYKRFRQIRFKELYETLENFKEFMEPELLQLRELIENKLKAMQEP